MQNIRQHGNLVATTSPAFEMHSNSFRDNMPAKIIESKLYNAECTKTMRTFTEDSIDCIITDPPYNLGLFMQNRNTNLKKCVPINLRMQVGTIWNLRNGREICVMAT